MCFGGAKTPSLPATPAPTPVPTPTQTNPVLTEGQRALKIQQMKSGMLSTIKTSPQGVSGTGSDLAPNQLNKKTVLGA